jgi:hypothetical protein
MPKPTLFVVTDELRQVLDNLPALEPKSRLDPLRPFIMRWRREGRSYRMIQEILQNECKVRIHNETLRRFVKRRLKPRKPKPEIDLEPEATQPVNSSSAAVSPVERKPRMSIEEREAARAALRASFETPLFPTEERKPLFERRPGPIRNLNNEVTKGDK